MKWYERLVVGFFCLYAALCMLSDIKRWTDPDNTPSRSPVGLQAQIEHLRERLDEVGKYKQQVEEVKRENRLLDMRTAHLDAEEFRKELDKDTDWRIAPEVRKKVLLNHGELLYQQLNKLRAVMAKNQDHIRYTDNDIEKAAKAVETEIKALPAEEAPPAELPTPPKKKRSTKPKAPPAPKTEEPKPEPPPAEPTPVPAAPKVEVSPPALSPR